MAIGDRLKRMQEAAEARGPLEPDRVDDGEWSEPTRLKVPELPVLDSSVAVFPETAHERTNLFGGNAGLDCETFLIQPGRNTPRLVVTGYQAANGKQMIVTGDANDPRVHALAFLAFTEAIITDALAQASRKVMGTLADPGVIDMNPDALATRSAVVGRLISGLLVNQNIAFDFCVLAEDAHQCDKKLGLVGKPESFFERVMQRIFELLDMHLVEDTMLREQLVDLAEGTLGKDTESVTKEGNFRRKGYNLKVLVKKYLGADLDKFTWRTGYYRYLNKPLSAYPSGAVDYLTLDVSGALHTAARQQVRAQLHGLPVGERIPNSAEQSKAAFAFQLLSSWGIRTNLQKVQHLDADLDQQARKLIRVLHDEGLIRKEGKREGTRDLKRTQELVKRCYEEAGLPVPLTKPKNGRGGGNISLSGSTLEDIALIRLRGSAKDVLNEKGEIDETKLMEEPLYAYSQFISIQKLQNTYLPVLYDGARYPINARFDIIKETGRISCYQPNLTNLPRGGTKTLLQRLQSRVRECFVPRDGFVFCSVDYNTLELCTLAQVCLWMLGESRLAEAINNGIDPHLLMAAEQFLHISYEEALARKKEKQVADMRQLVKAANFGLPGGLGPYTFIDYAKASYNVFLKVEEAKELKEKWLRQWPEMRTYFRQIAAMMRGYDDKGNTIGDIEQFVSGRIRGRTRYTAACNSFFQGLAADGAKAALYAIQKASYLLAGALYGSRVVAFVHDEIIMEHPARDAAERGQIQADIMVNTMQTVCPDVKIGASPALMRAWFKNADAVYDERGRLIPWEPGVEYVKGAHGLLTPKHTSFLGVAK